LKKLIQYVVLILAIPFKTYAQETVTVIFSVGGKDAVFKLELARHPDQWHKGLSQRTTLKKDRGMLFDFLIPRHVVMWMKETLIPLDILFLNAQGEIINIYEQAKPLSLKPITSQGMSRYVIELNGGMAKQLNLKPGLRVKGLLSETISKH